MESSSPAKDHSSAFVTGLIIQVGINESTKRHGILSTSVNNAGPHINGARH